jgi:hypothetical protein
VKGVVKTYIVHGLDVYMNTFCTSSRLPASSECMDSTSILKCTFVIIIICVICEW